jgi:hypothetical protein
MRPIVILLALASPFAAAGSDDVIAEVTLPAGEVASIRSKDKVMDTPLAPGPRGIHLRAGQAASIEIIREARYPIEFDPAQVVDVAAAARGEGGVVPQTPTAFQTTNVGWTISLEARPGPQLITLIGKATYTAVELSQSVHGEGAGPIMREYTDKRGRKQTDLISPNVGLSAIERSTCTNFQIYAKPGKAYQIPVRRGEKVVKLEIVCDRGK